MSSNNRYQINIGVSPNKNGKYDWIILKLESMIGWVKIYECTSGSLDEAWEDAKEYLKLL